MKAVEDWNNDDREKPKKQQNKVELDGSFWIGTVVGSFIEKIHDKIKALISNK